MAKQDGGAVMELGEPANGAMEELISLLPYTARLVITGTADLLFHKWNVEAVAEKGRAAKGSKVKKTDNVESYVYRDQDQYLCLPGEYLRQSIINSAKYKQDPRSPRKSAMDLYKAGLLSETLLARIGPTPSRNWQYEDARRVVVQRNGVTRVRPAFKAGWTAEVLLTVLTPEYIQPEVLLEVANQAGRLIGVGDFRPTYGRFSVSRFDVVKN